jgi:Zn-dependent peptidase ImmA (M78 family)
LTALHLDAESSDVFTVYCPLGDVKSLIINDNGAVAIGLNTDKIEDRADETWCMGHEMGHFHMGTYYTLYSAIQLREKAEYKADVWMVEFLLPPAELKQAVKDGYTEVWELAEYFDVPEHVVLRAAYIYKCKEIL